jgi:hypothetical protein
MAVGNAWLLGASDLARLQPNLKKVHLTRGRFLHPVGVPIEHVYFPDSGMVSLLTVMKSGEQIETAIIGNEGVVGGWVAIDGRNANTQSTVQMEGSAWQIPTAIPRNIQRERPIQVRHKQLSRRHSISGATKRGLSCHSLGRSPALSLALARAGPCGGKFN